MMIGENPVGIRCVYAAKVMRNERSEMEHSRSEMPAKGSITICIPAGCDFSIIWQFDVVAFRWNA